VLPNDWKNETLYPPSDADTFQWAWEFLRRNHNYRRIWNALSGAPDALTEHVDVWNEFGVREVCNPDTEYSLKLLVRLCPSGIEITTLKDHEEMASRELARRTKPQKASEAVIKFNLDMDIEGQLLEASVYLEKAKLLLEITGAKGKEKRRRRDRYGWYLQLLDAEQQIEHSSELDLISKIVGALKIEEQDPASTNRKLQKNLKRAREIRDGLYRFLLPGYESSVLKFKPAGTKQPAYKFDFEL